MRDAAPNNKSVYFVSQKSTGRSTFQYTGYLKTKNNDSKTYIRKHSGTKYTLNSQCGNRPFLLLPKNSEDAEYVYP